MSEHDERIATLECRINEIEALLAQELPNVKRKLYLASEEDRKGRFRAIEDLPLAQRTAAIDALSAYDRDEFFKLARDPLTILRTSAERLEAWATHCPIAATRVRAERAKLPERVLIEDREPTNSVRPQFRYIAEQDVPRAVALGFAKPFANGTSAYTGHVSIEGNAYAWELEWLPSGVRFGVFTRDQYDFLIHMQGPLPAKYSMRVLTREENIEYEVGGRI